MPQRQALVPGVGRAGEIVAGTFAEQGNLVLLVERNSGRISAHAPAFSAHAATRALLPSLRAARAITGQAVRLG